MKRFAFTMLELVFVIIVVGIIAVLAMPNFKSNPLQQAAEQVANHIRYTQHLAMVEDKFDDKNITWYKSFWRIRFYKTYNPTTCYYTIFSDRDQNGNADYTAGKKEIAVDPLKHINMHVSNDNKDMGLTSKYGITDINATCDSANIDIFFDNLGRPYADSVAVGANLPYSKLLQDDCNITLSHPDGTAIITIRPETGYVSLTYN
jgi:type II secretory pathway pseudopilin PulG